MRLTIITINYNNRAGLERTVRSVVAQSCQDFEYVIVDGASTDGSVEVMRMAEGYGFSLKVSSEHDTGIYNAMNKGIRRATGDWLLFLNSGDWLVDENVVRNLYNRELLGDIIEGDTRCMRGDTLSHIWYAPERVTANTFYSGSICHQSALIRRILFNGNLYDEGKKIASDMEFFFKKLVLEGASYQRVAMEISCFDVDGVSNSPKWKRVHEQEVNEIRHSLMPSVFLPDYEKYILQRSRLEVWSQEHRDSLFVRFWSVWFNYAAKVKSRFGI